MTDGQALREKLRKIEALFAGAATAEGHGETADAEELDEPRRLGR
jgi:hypothetical protein